MPKVSIIVPIFNVEKYLRECLDSLINQTLDDIEIICVNDGSTDNSAQILQEYRFKDKRIKVINKENSGYGISMNMGLDVANGEFIGIVESDDFADSKMFEDLYNLAKEKNADIVKSDWLEYTTSTGAVRKAGRMALLPEYKDLNVKDNPEILKIQPATKLKCGKSPRFISALGRILNRFCQTFQLFWAGSPICRIGPMTATF